MTTSKKVQNALFQFLQSHVSDLNIDDIDEIVISYVAGILEDLMTSNVDVDLVDAPALHEMLTAYVPQTEAALSQGDLATWIVTQAQAWQEEEAQGRKVSTLNIKSVIQETTAIKVAKAPAGKPTASVLSEESDIKPRRLARLSETSDGTSEGSMDGEELQQSVSHLLEMFPYSCTFEINHCLQMVFGDMERAAQLIMHRHENGQSLKNTDRKVTKIARVVVDDRTIKNKILGKYGFVDQDEDARYHRPIIKKTEEKKLIRYRDGKIVSTKGERFTQVSKQESEEMKKSIVTILSK